jgi:CRP-like cAMP-binding protein
MLRKLQFLTDFENVELWEILRISVWREVAPRVVIMREGERERNFGVLVEGFVEVSIGGSELCRLGPGEVIGEMAFLHPSSSERSASVTTLETTLFLEINAAALALASEELQERVRSALLARMIARLREVNRIAAAGGAPAIESAEGPAAGGRRQSPGGALKLTPM